MYSQLRRLDCLIGRVAYFIFCFFRIDLKKRNRIISLKVKKIICIKLWGLGNLTILYPLIYRLKEKFPQAKLIFVTFDINRGFLERNEAIDGIVYFKLTKNLISIIWQSICLLISLKKEGFDILINFETFNHASALFSYLTGIPERIGFYTKCEKIFYTHPCYLEKSTHLSQAFLNLMKPLDLNFEYQYFNYRGTIKERKKIESLLSYLNIREFICFHIGTSDNFKGKRYKLTNFVKLVNFLTNTYGISIIFTGTENERDIINDVANSISLKDKTFNLCGQLNLWEFVELIKRAILFVSGDTGVVHLAASLRVNLVVFYGPTSPQRYKPLNENIQIFYKNMSCSPCMGIDYINKRCKANFSCLDFPPQEVFSKIKEKFFNAKKN